MIQKCYKSIVVVDSEDERDSTKNILITTVNCDGITRYWSADDIDDFREWWNSEDYDGPSSDDEVIEFTIEGENAKSILEPLVYSSVIWFEHIVDYYGF